jgi:4-amino-4-deoxy-L-arabinose transferase-like glycosyltransferase
MLHSRLLSTLENYLALAILAVVFFTSIAEVNFGEDESHWIHTSSYLEIFFTEKPSSPFWSEHYWTLTQPPMTRYLIGSGRLLGGYGRDDLNTPWQFDQDTTWNITHGNLPDLGLLWWSRLPMALLGSLSGWMIFILLKQAAGRLAGGAFLISYIFNPYFLTHLRRAMSESPLLFFIILTALICAKALKELNIAFRKDSATLIDLRKSTVWFVLAGGCCGLAGASKINGLFSTAGLVFLVTSAVFVQPRAVPPAVRRSYVIRTAILSLFAALLVFIAVNPYLYSNPLVNTARMFKFRVQEMMIQVAGFPENVLHGLTERIQVISRRIFEDYTWPGFKGALALNLPLAAVGLAGLIWKLRFRWQNTEAGISSAVLLFIPAPLIAAALVTPLDWNRYYLFPEILTTCFCSAGFAITAVWIMKKLVPQTNYPKF